MKARDAWRSSRNYENFPVIDTTRPTDVAPTDVVVFINSYMIVQNETMRAPRAIARDAKMWLPASCAIGVIVA